MNITRRELVSAAIGAAAAPATSKATRDPATIKAEFRRNHRRQIAIERMYAWTGEEDDAGWNECQRNMNRLALEHSEADPRGAVLCKGLGLS